MTWAIYLTPAILFGEYKTGVDCLPQHLHARLHDDFPWPVSIIPRRMNVICGISPPRQVLGNNDYRSWQGRPKPIPLPGHYQISEITIPTRYLWDVRLHYFAFTADNEHHLRLGWFRWDDIDNFYTLPTFTVKWIEPSWERALWFRYTC